LFPRELGGKCACARKLNIPTQEASRHLIRLAEIGLIAKSSDGLYSLTPYGAFSLRLLDGERFAATHRDYSTHTAVDVSLCFTSRISELNEATFVDDVMITFHNVERVIKEANEYIVRMTDRYQLTAIPHIGEALERGVKIRVIEPLDIVRPPGYKPDLRLDQGEDNGRWQGSGEAGCLPHSFREGGRRHLFPPPRWAVRLPRRRLKGPNHPQMVH
jgi:hypothetical protein